MAFDYRTSKAWTAYTKTASPYSYRSDGERLRGTFTCDTVPAAVSGGALTVRLEYEEYKNGDKAYCRGTTTILEGSVLVGVFNQPNAAKQYSWMRPLLLEMLSYAGGGGGVCVRREAGGAIVFARDVEVPNSQAFLFYLAGKGVKPVYRENGKRIAYALIDSAAGGGKKGVFRRYGEARRVDDDEDPHANGFNYVKSKAWTAYSKNASPYQYRSDGERLRGTFTCDTVPAAAAAVSGGARRGALTVRLEYEEYKAGGDRVQCRGTTTILEGSMLAGVFDQHNARKDCSWMRPLLLEMLSSAGGGVCVRREAGGAIVFEQDVEVPNAQSFLFYLAGKGVQPTYQESGKLISYALIDSAVGGGRKGVFKRVVSTAISAPAAAAASAVAAAAADADAAASAAASTSTSTSTASASAAGSGSQKKLPRSVRLERYLASLDEQARLKRELGDEVAAAAASTSTNTSGAVVVKQEKQERKYARRRY